MPLLQHVTGASLLVTPSLEEAKDLMYSLGTYLEDEEYAFYPPLSQLPYRVLAVSKDLEQIRLSVLRRLLSNKLKVVVTTTEALLERLAPLACYTQNGLIFKLEDEVKMENLATNLVSLGYIREEIVETNGQFAVRGGVLDVFGQGEEEPWRLEFFGDEIESIRCFDINTQRTVNQLVKIEILPAVIFSLTVAECKKAHMAIKEDLDKQEKSFASSKTSKEWKHFRDELLEDLDFLEEGKQIGDIQRLLPYFYKQKLGILDCFPGNSLVVLFETMKVVTDLEQIAQDYQETFTSLLANGVVLPKQSESNFWYQEVMEKIGNHKSLFFNSLPQKLKHLSFTGITQQNMQTITQYGGNLILLQEDLRFWLQEKYTVVFLLNEERSKLLQEELNFAGFITTKIISLPKDTGPHLYFLSEILNHGFVHQACRLVLLGEQDLYGKKRKKRIGRSMVKGSKISSFTDLNIGDFIVHHQHGIGKYLGIESLQVGGVRKDYIAICYAAEAKLFLPIEQISNIQKYIGSESHGPKLSKMGGSDWQKVKTRTKKGVEDMADELLKLYQERASRKGYAFSEDSEWVSGFESAFPYEETVDQLEAINAVKQDMESDKPMDRIVLGDVGYGKTEVALRSAFKAVMDSKQVAMLVPTTVLSQQHYETFLKRMKDFPVRIGLLNRFRSPKEQKKTLAALKCGMCDILIGTHRILSKDVLFKDLGLVVVDEEQKFGVAHKEKLKQLCVNVDYLCLTATPIPRTLQMSFSGARDLSIIETPPEERLPVQVFVLEYQEVWIKTAISRELSRGGQVFYLHNKILDIEKVVIKLRLLLPNVEISFAHGQMDDLLMEQTMMDFINGDIQVLVCTTIIENGLDIRNVNTIIVDEADKLGLSQLYQLKGRVGRSNRQAYAYFAYQPQKVLNEVAEKRLKSIKEFAAFGSGFKIAMRDLEIRGAGNMLGSEQHGHMAAVGFEMYMQMLEETVRDLQGENHQIGRAHV